MSRILKLLPFAVVIVCATAGAELAPVDSADWASYCEIWDIPEAGEKALAHLEVDGPIFDSSKNVRLSDLRIIRDGTEEVPHVVHVRPRPTQKLWHSKMFNLSRIEGKSTTFTLDLGEAPHDINRIRLHTPSRNFRRAARIEGSSDLKQWSVLRDDASIFDFSADVRAAFTTLRFPASRFRYLRVTILDEGQEPLKITGATVLLESKLKKSAPELLRTWPVANMQRKELVEEKQTELILDLACRNVPSQEIEFEIPAVNFWRNVSLEISNDRKRWRRVSGGTVFNFKTDRYNRAETVLKYPERAGRYIRVVIHNQDDAPIEISSVTVRGQRRHVYFPVPAAGSYRVYMGNPKAWTAQYEFAKVFPHLSLAGAARVTVGKVEKNPDRIVVVKQEPWAERNKWVIYLAMIIVVIVLGWLAINVWGRMAKEPDAAA